MFESIKARYLERKKKKAIASIRHEIAFCGSDLSDYSDEEIEEACVEISKVVSTCGVTAQEAAAALYFAASL